MVGRVVSEFYKNFEFGPNIKTRYNSRLGKTVNEFPHQVQVRFGDKGDNIQFKNRVKGLVVSEATIKFGQR